MRPLILARLVLLLIFFTSCEKRVQYDGTVYTKTGEPLNNVEVKFWYADADDAFVSEMTNDRGVFVLNKRLQKGQNIKELTVNSIHGDATRPLLAGGESGMKVELK